MSATEAEAGRSKVTARDVRAALDRKYGQGINAGRLGEQWVVIQEARSGAGFAGNDRQCDYLAINTYQGRGMQVIGHEIKVSMADWRKELEQPEKAEAFARYCRRWWVVMPSALATKVRNEVPPTWGLMSVSDSGRITQLVDAPAREPDQVPAWWWVGWLAQRDREDRRRSAREVDQLLVERLTAAEERWKRVHAGGEERSRTAHAALLERVTAFETATGVHIAHTWGDFSDLVRAKAFLDAAPRLDVLVGQLRKAADALAAADAPAGAVDA